MKKLNFQISWFKNGLILYLILIQTLSTCLAAENSESLYLVKDLPGIAHGSEFISGTPSNLIMIKVNLLGAVNRPGIHFVPMGTSLLTLLSYAGGPLESAELGNTTIKRQEKDKTKITKVDLEDILRGSSQEMPVVQPDDIIVIPQSRPFISQSLMNTVGFISSILSLAALVVALKK